MENTRLMEVLGPSFFLCILLLQRTGYHTPLGRSLVAVETLRATLPKSTQSDRDKFLGLFRGQLTNLEQHHDHASGARITVLATIIGPLKQAF